MEEEERMGQDNMMARYLKAAIDEGLCMDYRQRWLSAYRDRERLFRLGLSQQALPHLMTFAHKGRGLTREYLTTEYAAFVNGRYTAVDADGVRGGYRTTLYVSYEGDFLSACDDVMAMMWCNIPTMEIPTSKAVKIYCGCTSTAHLVCGGYNSVHVMLYDDSRIFLDDVDETSNITIYRYSDKTGVGTGKFCLKEPKVFDKELRF